MKIKILSVLLVLVAYSFAKTNFCIVTTGTTDFSIVCPRVKIFLSSKEEEKRVSYYGFANVATSSWTFYNGPKLHPAKWVNFGLYVGLETHEALEKIADIPDSWKIATDITFKYKKLSVYTLYENGASGFFLLPIVSLKINDVVKTDVLIKAFEGVTKLGPGVKITVLKHLAIRLAGYWCFEKEKADLEFGTVLFF